MRRTANLATVSPSRREQTARSASQSITTADEQLDKRTLVICPSQQCSACIRTAAIVRMRSQPCGLGEERGKPDYKFCGTAIGCNTRAIVPTQSFVVSTVTYPFLRSVSPLSVVKVRKNYVHS